MLEYIPNMRIGLHDVSGFLVDHNWQLSKKQTEIYLTSFGVLEYISNMQLACMTFLAF